MNFEALTALAITLASLLNIALTYYFSKKRIGSEVDKLKAEKESSFGEAAESNMDAAKTSNELLLQRIAELKREKRDAWNYIAMLKKQIIEECRVAPVEYVPLDSEPKIK